MKIYKRLTLLIVLILGISVLGASFLNVAAEDPIPPTLEMVATYNAAITLDGDYGDWNSSNERYFDIFSIDEVPTEILTVTVNFAYTNTHLYFYAYIPADEGHVKAMDIHFFGKPDQNDGVHMYAYHSTFFDMAFTGDGPPSDDVSIGGTNDGTVAMIYASDNGSYFEGMKPLNSGDIKGQDINLGYGQAIAVSIDAWINIFPDSEGPNFGSKTTDEFRYIRLDIGNNLGDSLEIYPGGFEGTWLWSEGEELGSNYYSGSIAGRTLSGSEPITGSAEYKITLGRYNFSTGEYDPTKTLEIKVFVCHDGTNMYFYFEYYDETDTEGDWLGIIIGKSNDMLNYSDDLDFIMVGYGGYQDAYLPGNRSSPIDDTSVGGSIDGSTGVSYANNTRTIEFVKPLKPNDPDGRDFDFEIGDYLYIMFLASYDTYDGVDHYGGPNYFEMTEIEGKPHFVVHPLKLLKEGESLNTEPSNTLSLAFDFFDLLIIACAVTPVFTIIYLRRRK